MNFVEVRKKENLNIKSMADSVNASRNILKEGLKNISAGTVEYKGGEEIRPTLLAHSVTYEAQPIAYGVGG